MADFDPATYNPKTMFIRVRAGRTLMFDRQIQNWRRDRKPKGCLKDSKRRNGAYASDPINKKMRNVFE